MRAFLFVALLASAAAVQTNPDFSAKLETASAASDIKQDHRFSLVASISASSGGKTATGTYRLIWISKDKWREDIVIGADFLSHVEVEGSAYDKYSTRKAQYVLEPLQSVGIYPPVPPLDSTEIKVENKKRNKHRVQCFDYKNKNQLARHVCLNEEGLITDVNDFRFDDFHSELGKRFPFHWSGDKNGIEYQGKIELLQAVGVEDIGPRLFAMDDTWRSHPSHCDQMGSIELLKNVRPKYPEAARQARVQGAVVIRANISAKGDIEDPDVISGHPMLREAALEAVKHWKYKPLTCDGKPMPIDTVLTVNFSFLGG